jgi:putative ABC transport system substrate-binding protein
VRRRDFIKGIAVSVAWPLAARAQQPERMRRIGVLMNRAASDAEGQARLAAFRQALEQLGWSEGRNVQIDIRWGEDKVDLQRKYAAELVALAPDAILASGTMSVMEVQALSRKLPIVFAAVADPVGAGFVESMAHPGGNATGFMLYEYSLGGKYFPSEGPDVHLSVLYRSVLDTTLPLHDHARPCVLRTPSWTSGIGCGALASNGTRRYSARTR